MSVEIISLFARLINHQPAVLFSQNEPASSTLLAEQTSHQPTITEVEVRSREGDGVEQSSND
jgi:hypothetical protein